MYIDWVSKCAAVAQLTAYKVNVVLSVERVYRTVRVVGGTLTSCDSGSGQLLNGVYWHVNIAVYKQPLSFRLINNWTTSTHALYTLTHSQHTQTISFASICDDADCKLFTRITGNTQHLLYLRICLSGSHTPVSCQDGWTYRQNFLPPGARRYNDFLITQPRYEIGRDSL